MGEGERRHFSTTQELIQYLRSEPVEPKKLEETTEDEQVLQTD